MELTCSAPGDWAPRVVQVWPAAADVVPEQACFAVVGAEKELPVAPEQRAYWAWAAELYALEQSCWGPAAVDAVALFAELACFEAAPV